MKRIILSTIWLVFLVWSTGNAQTAVRTENSSNKYKIYTAATTGDTLVVSASSIVSGSSIPYYNTCGYLVRIIVGTPVANDTIIIKNGVGTVCQLVQPASAPFIYNFELGTRLDTSLIFIQKKASASTLVFRIKY